MWAARAARAARARARARGSASVGATPGEEEERVKNSLSVLPEAMVTPIRTVMVLGYGTMGRGVLASFAAHGFDTIIVSRNPDALGDLPEGTVAAGPGLPTLATPPDLIGTHGGHSTRVN